ncbi:hypothetical protein DID88_005387 [Monilinia fructigena]|uniref:Uncharacterized protein n=1 Tax=Monilinia fructigena TaxID=38457 RepID=A0A395J4Z7_9HELO|nr:hypothetical protein DID88_005387 [Monilinia fructigena]
MGTASIKAQDSSGLRERNNNVPPTNEDNITSSCNASEIPSEDLKLDKNKKTFGRTPNGTIFTVPQTHDMVSQLLDPRQPKNLSDLLVLIILALHILALYALPSSLKRPIFAVLFLFWRGCYNVGIGYLLHIQSHHRRIVAWAKKWNLFENPNTGKNPLDHGYTI